MRLLRALWFAAICGVMLLYLIIVGIPTIIYCRIAGNPRPALQLTRLLDYIVLFLAGLKFESEGMEKLDPSRGYVYVANHRSFADPAVLLVALKGRIHFLIKKEVFKIPLVGLALATMGMIEINRGNREEASASVERAADKLKSGDSVIFFPEGTRNRTSSTLLPFKKGAFVLAVAAQAPIVPITVLGSSSVLPAGTMQLHSCTIRLIVHDPIETTGRSYDDRNELLELARAAIEKALPASR